MGATTAPNILLLDGQLLLIIFSIKGITYSQLEQHPVSLLFLNERALFLLLANFIAMLFRKEVLWQQLQLLTHF
jgi:hypothetical protein